LADISELSSDTALSHLVSLRLVMSRYGGGCCVRIAGGVLEAACQGVGDAVRGREAVPGVAEDVELRVRQSGSRAWVVVLQDQPVGTGQHAMNSVRSERGLQLGELEQALIGFVLAED
jgi:hypothetical protein